MSKIADRLEVEQSTTDIKVNDDNSWENYSAYGITEKGDTVKTHGRRKRRINADAKYYQG